MDGYKGIDYSLGQSNYDPKTGIHFGVISQHSVGAAWYEDSVPEYGKPTCPRCGEVAQEYSEDLHGDYSAVTDFHYQCADYACGTCHVYFDSGDAYPDEPLGFHFEDSEYRLVDCLDTDIMVLQSPYYTFAQYCSPCVPGAGNLEEPIDNGVKTYCLGHDWFEDDKAPYPVYSVADDSIVESEN